jgi:hypothetical protein
MAPTNGYARCATTDRCTLPDLSAWYLTTNLSAPLDEIVRLHGLRNWVEQSYKQMKDELDWTDFMVLSDRAIRRHAPASRSRQVNRGIDGRS